MGNEIDIIKQLTSLPIQGLLMGALIFIWRYFTNQINKLKKEYREYIDKQDEKMAKLGERLDEQNESCLSRIVALTEGAISSSAKIIAENSKIMALFMDKLDNFGK